MSEEFAVNDRRLFSKDGRLNAEARDGETPAADREIPAAAGRPADRDDSSPSDMGHDSAARAAAAGFPPPAFPSLLVGLASSALLHLGESPEPGAASPEINLPAAKQAIDLLGLLQAKTKGNLEDEEKALLETLLYDLRLKYVKASR